MVHCEIGTESTWESFVLQCNKNKENMNNLASDNGIKRPVSHRRDDSRDDSPTRRESLQQQYSSTHVTKPKHINIGSRKKASPTSVRTKLNSGGSSKKKKSSRHQSAEWLDLSTDYTLSSPINSSNNSPDNSIDDNDDNIDPNELVNQLNQIYIDQLLDVSEEKQNESLNLSIEIDDNNIMYLSPPLSPQRQQQTPPQTKPIEGIITTTNTSVLDLTNDIALTPSTSFLQLDIGSNDNEEMNVLECSEITLGSSFLIELDSNDIVSNDIKAVAAAGTAAVDMSIDEIEIVMNEHQNATRKAQNTTIEETPNQIAATNQLDAAKEVDLDVQHHTLNNSTITCDEFITEALQTSFIDNVKLGYNVVTNKLEKEFRDMGFGDCISG